MAQNPGAYLISVSIEKGCYRHIKISEKALLEELSNAILEAFAFDDDHGHAFFMNNKAWSDVDCYYTVWVEDEARYTRDYTLAQVGLQPNKKFLYLFDFGEEWRFSCRVLQHLEEEVPKPVVVVSKGKPPEQYGYFG